MDLEKLIAELEALIAKYADGTPDDVTEEQAANDAERMSELSAEIERMSAEQSEQRRAREDAITTARAAIERGSAARVDNVPLNRSASARGGVAYDVTDYGAAHRRGWVKEVATSAGVQLIGGNELTTQERAAFTHLTTNTGSIVPKEIKGQIISLIDNGAVLFGDIPRSNFKNQFEIPRHISIAAGDAASTTEGAAPTDEQNAYDPVPFVGTEIKKTVKLSRKMAVQSVDGFEQYLINEIGARMAVAANAYAHAQLAGNTVGIADANKIETAAANKLTKADITAAFAKLKTYGNPVPKGCVIYANSDMIWNNIAMIEDGNKRSYFLDEKTDDPAVQGRIFGRIVKQDDAVPDGVMLIGCPDLIKGNVFDGIDVTGYVATDGTQRHCFDGYLLYDCGLVVPNGFAQLTIKTTS